MGKPAPPPPRGERKDAEAQGTGASEPSSQHSEAPVTLSCQILLCPDKRYCLGINATRFHCPWEGLADPPVSMEVSCVRSTELRGKRSRRCVGTQRVYHIQFSKQPHLTEEPKKVRAPAHSLMTLAEYYSKGSPDFPHQQSPEP